MRTRPFMARRNVTVLKDTWWMHTHARESPLSLEKIHLPHYELQTKCCNAANFYNMLSQGMPARKSRNRALGWRETLNNALHTSQHTELDDNMKEHLNRTACGFFSSNCSTPSRQQHCSDDPIMSCFLLVRLLMNHQGKHFPARRMQESGSCTARRLPLEESLWSSSGRKGECSRGMCMSASTGIYWGRTCIASKDWTSAIFVCRGDWGLRCCSVWESIQTIYSHCTRPAVPGLLSLCCEVLLVIASAPHFSKSSTGKWCCISLNDLLSTTASLTSLPVRGRVSYQISSYQHVKGKHWLSCLGSSKLLHSTSPGVMHCQSCSCGLPGEEGREQSCLWCFAVQH